MRNQKIENILRVAFAMQSSAEGITLQDISQILGGVSRRTAERARDTILQVFPQTEEILDVDTRFKRWRIPSRTLRDLTTISLEELMNLSTAATLCKAQNLSGIANSLENLREKIKGGLKSELRLRMETDLAAQADAETFVSAPHAAGQFDHMLLLRLACVGCRKVEIRLPSKFGTSQSPITVSPYGIIFGASAHWLVTKNEADTELMLFPLSNLQNVHVLEYGFVKPSDFNLKDIVKNIGDFDERPDGSMRLKTNIVPLRRNTYPKMVGPRPMPVKGNVSNIVAWQEHLSRLITEEKICRRNNLTIFVRK